MNMTKVKIAIFVLLLFSKNALTQIVTKTNPDYTSMNNVQITSKTRDEILADETGAEVKVLVKMLAGKSITQILTSKVDTIIESMNIFALQVNKDDLHALENDPNVEYVEIDHTVRAVAEEPIVHKQQGGRSLAETIDYGVQNVLQNITFWDKLPTPKDEIKICVCDTGYDLGHDDLPNSGEVVGFNNPNINEKWTSDGLNHGTHVAGIIAAIGGNNKGMRGVIPNNKDGKFKLMITKCLDKNGEGFIGSIIFAMDQCVANGANILNLSLGTSSYSTSLSKYVQKAYKKGVLIVSAAGNEANESHFYPASLRGSMSVAAVDKGSKKAWFNNVNNQVEISAPGVDIESTTKNNKYRTFSGTSMAAPHVVGVAGLLWMYFPECSNQQIRNAILASAKSLDKTNECNKSTGYGLLQAIDAYNLLVNWGCSGYANITNAKAKGGCKQLDTQSLSCSIDSDCDDNDPCTVDSCSADGTCTTSMDCAQCQKDSLLTIDIVTDTFPYETTWDIRAGSTTYASGGPYAQMMMYSSYVCLSAGSYTFAIYDEYIDGLCCAGGNGSYDLSLDDTVLKVGGSFNRGESTSFDVIKAS